MLTHFHPAWVQADKSAEPKVQRLLRSAPIASRRTEGIAIVTQSVNRVRCPLKPWGPAGGNGRGPRRKCFRWGNLGGTRRRGLNNIAMSEDGGPFQTRGGGVPEFGVPAKYHSEARTLCGVSVRRGSLTSMLGDGSLFSSTGTTLTPSECYLVLAPRSRRGNKVRRSGLRRVIKQLRCGSSQAAGFSSRT